MWDELDNADLLEQVLDSGVTAVAFTLYLWLFGSLTSRRLFVRLKQGGRYSAGWREQVEDLLERYFI